MPGMKEIKSRIKSVQSTRQITNAMEIVSTTKFKKYSKLVSESRPYEESMRKILSHIAAGTKNERHPLFDGREEVKSIAIIVITSDRGLCGSFNSSTLKELEKLVKQNEGKKISIIPFGRKAIDFATKRNYDFSESFSKFSAEEMNKIARDVSEDIVIKYNNENLEIEDFSEGEKKMILIKAALEFAAQEDSLFILDEPDAHIHLSNKVQIRKVFEEYEQNRQVIITTHSPTLTDCLDNESIYMLDRGKLISAEKQKVLESISGEFWNRFQQNTFIS